MIYVILVGLGLCFGSFVNALVWRLHEQSLPKKKRAASDKELSISTGRSMCPHCQHTLGFWDLLPLVSWLWLRGRCRYCHKAIGWQYPLVEAATALVFVATYTFWPLTLDGRGIFLLVVWLAALTGLMALIVYDVRWMLLPNKIVFPLIVLGLLQTLVVALAYQGGLHSLVNALYAVAIGGGVYYVLFQLSKGAWIGGGDVKLGYALGLFLATPSKAFLLLFVASLLGIILAVPGLVSKKLSVSSRIPFGPSLIIASAIVMLFGQAVIDWYLRFVGV